MKRRLFALIVISVLIGTGFGASAESDGGWSKARWGMSVADVRKEYPEAITFRGPVTKKGVLNARLEISQFEIGTRTYTVRFFFDSSDRLAEVNLTWNKPGQRTDYIYAELAADSLRKNLTEKYGRPTLTEPGGVSSHWVWTKPEVVIDLTFMPSASLVTLWYSKPDGKTLEKL